MARLRYAGGRLWPALLLFLAVCGEGRAADGKEAPFDDYRDGDIVLQNLEAPICVLIAAVTQSPYTHCGMVVHRRGKPYVLEAVGPVRYTSLRKWLKRGKQGRITVLRVTNLTPEQMAKAITVAKGFLGRPYDIQYRPDDARIYCSELVFRAFERGCGIFVGKTQRLGDLNWRPYESYIRGITGGDLPLDRRMITPAALVESPYTKTVYSTFPEAGGEGSTDTE